MYEPANTNNMQTCLLFGVCSAYTVFNVSECIVVLSIDSEFVFKVNSMYM